MTDLNRRYPRCPECGSEDLEFLPGDAGTGIRAGYECQACGLVFSITDAE